MVCAVGRRQSAVSCAKVMSNQNIAFVSQMSKSLLIESLRAFLFFTLMLFFTKSPLFFKKALAHLGCGDNLMARR